MNTQQIQEILENDQYVGPEFKGVYPIDRLPKSNPGSYVINTAPARHPGQHWVAVYLTPFEVEYFDSYGGDPPVKLKRWWKGKPCTSNPIPLQSPLSSVCGQYCIYYLLHRCRGIEIPTMLMDFGSDVDYNDQMIYDFVQDRYDIQTLKLLDTEGIVTQLARARISDPSIRTD